MDETKKIEVEEPEGVLDDTVKVEDLQNETGETIATDKRKKRVIIGAAAAVAVVALVGVGAAFALTQQPAEKPNTANDTAKPAQTTQASDKQDAKSEVVLTVSAEGADEKATKAKVVVKDTSGKVVVKETEVVANAEASLGDLPKGAYELFVTVAPVAVDGSTYKLPDAPTKFTVDGKGKEVAVESALSKLAKEDMTKEQLEAAASALADAGKSDAATSVTQAAQGASSVPGSAEDVSKPSGESSAQQSPSAGGSGSGGSSDAPSGGGASSQPAHQHTWVTQTTQTWVPNMVWVVDSAAWDEPVVTGSVVQASCGLVFNTTDEWGSHKMEMGRTHSCSYSLVEQWGTIHHEATGHNEDQGHYDTVTTGQVCSGCGATA